MSECPLDDDKYPPWDIHLVHHSSDPEHTHLLLRCSHTIGDGQLFMHLIQGVFDEMNGEAGDESASTDDDASSADISVNIVAAPTPAGMDKCKLSIASTIEHHSDGSEADVHCADSAGVKHRKPTGHAVSENIEDKQPVKATVQQQGPSQKRRRGLMSTISHMWQAFIRYTVVCKMVVVMLVGAPRACRQVAVL